MSMQNRKCDFCRLDDLLGEFDQSSLVFYLDGIPKLWCGQCREGSRIYFSDYGTPALVQLCNLTDKVLEDEQVEFESLDHELEAKMKFAWLSDEVFRAKQEITFRVLEA